MITPEVEELCELIRSRYTLGLELLALAEDHSQWSQATFGTDDERGPVGAMKHLALEAAEAVAAWEAHPFDAEAVRVELADCLLLLLDATRRAGSSLRGLILAAQEKMAVNRTRTYPKPTSDVPSEHIKETPK